MTRRDFALIADVIKSLPHDVGNRPMADPTPRALAAEAFAHRLKLVNPLFNREKFLTACGIS